MVTGKPLVCRLGWHHYVDFPDPNPETGGLEKQGYRASTRCSKEKGAPAFLSRFRTSRMSGQHPERPMGQPLGSTSGIRHPIAGGLITAAQRRRLFGSAVLTVATLLVVAGCSGGKAAPPAAVTISATPDDSLYDTPFLTSVSGLAGGQQITLAMTSTAKDGAVWSSQASFRAGPDGRLTTAQAPVDGAYTRADPMGLVETLSPGHDQSFSPPTPWILTETVQANGSIVASATITRRRPTEIGVRETDLRPQSDHVYGELFEPASTPATAQPAVVVVGGSEGGLAAPTVQAALLAAHGYPALALAYFAEPGLPASLEQIPLEYFATAAQLLATQPGVDSRRLVMWGSSRGTEAALLTAAHFPNQIKSVIAGTPSAEAVGGLPNTTKAAWTYDGRPVPTAPASEFDSQSANSPATIPVENIAGPVLLVCAGQDKVWESCPNSAVINTRLAAHARPAATILSYARAGHFVNLLLPYLPNTTTSGTTASGDVVSSGGTYQADQAACADAWPKVLNFLSTMSD